MTDDELKRLFAGLEAKLTSLDRRLVVQANSLAEINQRVVELERARVMHASKADVDDGEFRAAAAIGVVKAEVEAKLEAMRDEARTHVSALAKAGDGRSTENRILTGALGLLVVVAALVAHGDIPGGQFVATVTLLAGTFGFAMHQRARKRESATGQSIRPPNG